MELCLRLLQGEVQPDGAVRLDVAVLPGNACPVQQQLPDLGLPRFQLGNVILVAAPGAVDAAANLVDVRGDAADGGS